MSFILHPQLEKDGIFIDDLTLCRLLLINDSNYPWCVLVPRRDGIKEVFELSEADQIQLNKESVLLAKTLISLFDGEKMNVAALGNMVPQLHIHHIVRYQSDASWPAPIWGKVGAKIYSKEESEKIIKKIRQALKSKR